MASNSSLWDILVQNANQPYKDLFARETEWLKNRIRPDAHVLEMGCGSGKNTRLILEKTPFVSAIDIDPGAIEDAQANLIGFPELKLGVGDATSLPFPDNSFDQVVFFEIFVNLGELKQKSLEEIHRVLKDGGTMLFSSYADDALEARLEMYRFVGAPIKEIRGNGTLVFDDLTAASTSDQFSAEQLAQFCEAAGFTVTTCEKVPKIAYLIEAKK